MLHNSKYQISLHVCRMSNYADTARRRNQHVANVTRKYISTPVPTDVAVI
jgi:hypothetical protein